jgi:hypothetical protein
MHVSVGSGASVGTFEHVPSEPGSAHEVHAPLQALSQQTPCSQKPDAHSLAAEHEPPPPFLPHELLPLQTLGLMQSPSPRHALKHALPLQT